MRRSLFSIALAVLVGCHRPAAANGAVAPKASDGGDALPEVRVVPGQDHYLFSWYAADGKIHDASRLDAIPEASRRQVLVRDLARSSGQLQADRYLYLADLEGAAPDDGYPTSVVSRYSFEAQDDSNLPAMGADEPASDGGKARVVIYGTSWCGACRAAREHLRARHIPFADKDIEKDPAAAAELSRKAKRAGLHLGGVPVLDVEGHLLMGFDAATVDRLIDHG